MISSVPLLAAPAKEKDRPPPTAGPASPPWHWRSPGTQRDPAYGCASPSSAPRNGSLNGSRTYASQSRHRCRRQTAAGHGRDYGTIAGGGVSSIFRSAHSDGVAEYNVLRRRGRFRLRSQRLRDRLLLASSPQQTAATPFAIHPIQLAAAAEGETGSCGPIIALCLPAGSLPIAYVEATSFTINGERWLQAATPKSANPGTVGLLRRARHQERLLAGTAKTQWGKDLARTEA